MSTNYGYYQLSQINHLLKLRDASSNEIDTEEQKYISTNDLSENVVTLCCPFHGCEGRIIQFQLPTNAADNISTIQNQNENRTINKQVVRVCSNGAEDNEIGTKFISAQDVRTNNTKEGTPSNNGSKLDDLTLEVTDVFQFDNIGVSRSGLSPNSKPIKFTISNNEGKESATIVTIDRLLVCADCDKGPIGFAGLLSDDVKENEKELDRVKKSLALRYYLNLNSVIYRFR